MLERYVNRERQLRNDKRLLVALSLFLLGVSFYALHQCQALKADVYRWQAISLTSGKGDVLP
jgi:hypothetical protein